jgi:tetratricopeptide (TPR) repeat protein
VEVHKRLQPSFRPLLVAVGVGFIAIFCCLTWQRAIAFSEPENLWVDNLKKNPDSWQGHSHLGAILWQRSDVKGALDEWEQSVEFAPYLYETHNNFALALNRTGDDDPTHKQEYMDAALKQFNIAVGIDNDQFRVRANYANALLGAGNYELSIKQNRMAAGYYEEAITQYQNVLRYDPYNPNIYNSIGVACFQLDRLDDAINCFAHAADLFKRITGQTNPEFERNLEQSRLRRQQELEGAPPASQSPPPPPTQAPH